MKRVVITGCILIILASLLFFHTRGIIFHDGGYILQTAERMVKGEVIYKDFDFVYTPLSVYITAFLFKFFGQSVLVERIFSMLLSLIGIGSVLYISYWISRNLLISFIPVFIFLLWGPSHINFLSPVMLSIELSLLMIALYIQGLKTINKRYFFAAGLTTALTLLSKQNFGIALCITSFAFFCFSNPKEKIVRLIRYLTGVIFVFVIFAVYLIFTQSFVPFFQNMYFYMFKKILLENVLSTPIPYGKTILLTIAKFFIYTFPFTVSALGLIYTGKKFRKFIFLFVFVIIFYLLGIRPETDYVHLSPLLALTGIPLIIIWKSTKKNLARFALVISIIVMITGLYTALFNNYYRWEMPLVKDVYFVSDKNMRIWLDPKEYETLRFFKTTIDQYTKSSEYIYVNLHAPFIYFYVNRKNPIRYYYTQHYATGKHEQQEITDNLIAKNVRLIIADPSYSKRTTLVDDFITYQFHPIASHDNYIILLRNVR